MAYTCFTGSCNQQKKDSPSCAIGATEPRDNETITPQERDNRIERIRERMDDEIDKFKSVTSGI